MERDYNKQLGEPRELEVLIRYADDIYIHDATDYRFMSGSSVRCFTAPTAPRRKPKMRDSASARLPLSTSPLSLSTLSSTLESRKSHRSGICNTGPAKNNDNDTNDHVNDNTHINIGACINADINANINSMNMAILSIGMMGMHDVPCDAAPPDVDVDVSEWLDLDK